MSIVLNLEGYSWRTIAIAYNQLMMSDHPDRLYYPPPGTYKERLPTPALLIDLPALNFNLEIMREYFAQRNVKLRPHFKTHKCPEIAQRQIKSGAVGMTCAKLSEAEVLVAAGITDILIANQVVDPVKISRLARLARNCHLIVAIDQVDNLLQISKAAEDAASVVHVVIEIDVGLHRAGVEPGEPALILAKKATTLPGIHFSGLLGYEGFTMFELDRDVRRDNVHNAMGALVRTGEFIRQTGLSVEIISAGGTGTYDLTGSYQGVTEVEAGSYVFMDARYNQLGLPFKQALILLSTVISINYPGRCVIDAGMKSLSTDNGIPEIVTPRGLKLLKLNEEHGIIAVSSKEARPEVGSIIEIVPSHCCTTVNLHDRYYVIQDGQLVDIWEISGRGRSQ